MWKPPDRLGKYQQVSVIFQPMVDAMYVSLGQQDLTAIGTAMHTATWHDDQHDELDAANSTIRAPAKLCLVKGR